MIYLECIPRDCGIRNAIISNYKSIDSRTDAGALFENFVISERMKKIQYEKTYAKGYFWRTTAKSEIDSVSYTHLTLPTKRIV